MTPPASRLRPLRAPLLTGASVGVAVLLLYVRDPHVPGSYGFCPFLSVTGYDCPLCGGLRATNALAHADFAAALDHNALFVAAVPLLLAAWVRWLRSAATARPAAWVASVSTTLYLVAAVLLVFWLLRNLPGLEMLRAGR